MPGNDVGPMSRQGALGNIELAFINAASALSTIAKAIRPVGPRCRHGICPGPSRTMTAPAYSIPSDASLSVLVDEAADTRTTEPRE
jgi:hypothetical protein